MLKVLVSVPNRGAINPFMVVNLLAMRVPLYSEMMYFMPSGLEVDQAREESAELALKFGADYLFFRDDDVLVPPDALVTLKARKADIACAMYVTKSKPPEPIMFSGGEVCTGWEAGDVVKCDEAGLGCALIHADVFRKLSKPWFVSTHNKSDGEHPGGGTRCTEDIYFCRKVAKELGIKPIVDTSINCVHKDFETGEAFFWISGRGVWQTSGGTDLAVPPVGNPACPLVDLTKKGDRDEEVSCSSDGVPVAGDAGSG